MSPILEVHGDAILSQFAESHAQDDLVEGDQLRHEFTRHARRHEGEAVLECIKDFGRAVTQKHLTTTSLPAHVVGVVDVSDEVRLLEADDVSIFICAHLRLPLTKQLRDLLWWCLFGSCRRRFLARRTRARSSRWLLRGRR